LRSRLVEPLGGTEGSALRPESPGELNPDGDPELVEPRPNGAGREPGEVLRDRVAHHELPEGERSAAVQDLFVADRERRACRNRREQYICIMEDACELSLDPLPLGRGRQVVR